MGSSNSRRQRSSALMNGSEDSEGNGENETAHRSSRIMHDGTGVSDDEEDFDLSSVLQFLIQKSDQAGIIRLAPDASMGINVGNDERTMTDEDDEEEEEEEGNDEALVEYIDHEFSDGPVEDEGRRRSASGPALKVMRETQLTSCRNQLNYDTLMSSGRGIQIAGQHRPTSLFKFLSTRETGMLGSQRFTGGDKCFISSKLIPNTRRVITEYVNRVFCGTYSQNGDVLMTACQDCNIRLYNTNVDYRTLKYGFVPFKIIKARDVGWSILDTAFSPDGNHILYSSWSECVHLCNIYGDYETHEALPLCPQNAGDKKFCIFSLVFSQDGREILGGANDGYLYVYDIENKKRNLEIDSHDNDVNTVAFADGSSQILFSGGDDGLCKVWDRRTLNETNPLPVGVLAGHWDGITFVDSRGDGRHLITNSKDQSIKLWDMRVFSSQTSIDNARRAVDCSQWDYRWQRVPKKYSAFRRLSLKGDTSLMTYTGHCVLKTLIRCHFSPVHSTGQRYIYTGCAAGNVIIYDVLTGQVVKMLPNPISSSCVRDVSWHPYLPDIVGTSWNGTVSLCTYSEDDEYLDAEERKTVSPTIVTSRPTRFYNLRQRSTTRDLH